MPDFHNPYNFIPTPPRVLDDPDLGDHAPPGHGRYAPDYWSGRIRVTMTTVTPLIAVDAANEHVEQSHKTFPVRLDADGRPYVAPTSVKGMLRAAFEAVTNSRMGVFSGHQTALARRMRTNEALDLVPARICPDPTLPGAQLIQLLPGTREPDPQDPARLRRGPACAAWLPRWDRSRGGNAAGAVRYPNGNLPEHGDAAHAILQLHAHHRAGEHWKVMHIALSPAELPAVPTLSSPTAAHRVGDLIQVQGYVWVSGHNIGNKHDERFFFDVGRVLPCNPPDLKLKQQWEALIADYRSIERHGAAGPDDNRKWSRHIDPDVDAKKLRFRTGTLGYARLQSSGGRRRVAALYPVAISRDLHPIAPLELIDESLRPAERRSHLSPADRVFGWVGQQSGKDGTGGQNAIRGQLRVGPVSCERADAVEDLAGGLPLAILSTPKPQQARFYVGDLNGNPPPDGRPSDDATFGYRSKQNRLRGRKVYPYHRGLPAGYWLNPTQEQRQPLGARFHQEYRRKGGILDSQNRSVKGWIKPETTFSFDLWLTNLGGVELGALLCLLQLPASHHLALGGGKPLGFGAVRMDVDWSRTQLHSGQDMRIACSDLDRASLPPGEDLTPRAAMLVGLFKKAVQRVDGSRRAFADVPYISAFLRAAAGHPDNLPTHYPRHTEAPHVDGENFKWFVANERGPGPKLALARLDKDPGLPVQGGH